jgi:O-antigen/teichoic acid export membrane protein
LPSRDVFLLKSRSISSNFVINLVGALAPMAVALVTVPIYIHRIGLERYGILSLAWILLGYFGFLDLGLSRAAANALARLRRQSHERGEVLATSFALNAAFGAVGGLVLYLTGEMIVSRAVTLTPGLQAETHAALPWIAFLLPLALVNGVAAGAFESREQFLAANIINMIGSSAGQIVPMLFAILVSPALDVIIPVAVLCKAATALAQVVLVLRHEVRLSLEMVSFSRARGLLSYGGWVTVSGILSPLLSSIDQLVIARLLGASGVALYAVPMNLVMRGQIVACSLSRTLFPRLSMHDPDEARELAERASVTLGFAFGLCCAVGIVLVKPFLALWISEDVASQSGLVGQILLLGGWINGIAFIPYSQLQGQGRPDITAKLHLLEILPYLAALYLLTQPFGLPGAAAAWSLRVALDAGLLVYMARFSRSVLSRLAMPGVVLVASFAVAQALPTRLTAWHLLCATGAAIVTFALAAQWDQTSRNFAGRALRLLSSTP